jgi:hypothetical protein
MKKLLVFILCLNCSVVAYADGPCKELREQLKANKGVCKDLAKEERKACREERHKLKEQFKACRTEAKASRKS